MLDKARSFIRRIRVKCQIAIRDWRTRRDALWANCIKLPAMDIRLATLTNAKSGAQHEARLFKVDPPVSGRRAIS